MDGDGVLRTPQSAEAAVSDAARGDEGLHADHLAGHGRGDAGQSGSGEPSSDGAAQGSAWTAFEAIRAFVTGQLNVAQSVAEGQRSASMLLVEAEDELDGLKREFERFRLPTET